MRKYDSAMPFYRDHIHPHIVKGLGEPKPIRDMRERIIPLPEGTVLEIGVGPGVNFAHYNSARVNKIYALEANSEIIRLAEPQRRQPKIDEPPPFYGGLSAQVARSFCLVLADALGP